MTPFARSKFRIPVDDRPLVRRGVEGIFAGHYDMGMAGEAGDGSEPVEDDVVLMDLRMLKLEGIEAARLRGESDPRFASSRLLKFRGRS